MIEFHISTKPARFSCPPEARQRFHASRNGSDHQFDSLLFHVAERSSVVPPLGDVDLEACVRPDLPIPTRTRPVPAGALVKLAAVFDRQAVRRRHQ